MSEGHGSDWEAYTNRTQLEKTLASIVVGLIFAAGQALKAFFLVMFNIVRALI